MIYFINFNAGLGSYIHKQYNVDKILAYNIDKLVIVATYALNLWYSFLTAYRVLKLSNNIFLCIFTYICDFMSYFECFFGSLQLILLTLNKYILQKW